MNFVRPNNYLINFNNSFERMVAAIVSFIVGIIVFIYAWVSWNQAIAYDKLRTAYATGKVVDIQYNFKYFYTKSKNLNSKTKSYTTYVIETGTHDKMKTKGEYVVDPSDNKPYSIESVESSIKEIQVETERHNKITVKADKLAIDPKYINLNNTLMKVEYDPNNIENTQNYLNKINNSFFL